MFQTLFIYHFIAILITGLAGLLLFQMREHRPVSKTLLLGIFLLFGLALTAIFFPVDGFARIQLLAWEAFLYFPLFLLLGIGFFWNHKHRLAVGLIVLLVVTLLVAVDSFLIEPHWLMVTELEITDSPGEYEKRVLEIVTESNPDLILLAGDYLQERDPVEYQRDSEKFNQILHDADLSATLGIYAVRGNVDWNSWSDLFQDLEVRTFVETETVDLGPIILTGVGWLDSADPALWIGGGEKFHIVLGHSPNYSLGEIEGDLLLAGHTHGGQVKLPGIGPLLTISVVPRSWASGLTEIEPGKYLLVSRGIGLERGYAPRMRFLCRPELIILTLKPPD